MILPRREDAFHKAVMYRLLMHILDNSLLSSNIYFKGGTCALMLGFLDRFSVDLDFDLRKGADKNLLRKNLVSIFHKLNLQLKEESKKTLFFVLKYEAARNRRNTLKLGIVDNPAKANVYKTFYLQDIDRYAICQTKETMFANKLVSLVDRYEKYKTIAGRDLYDIHYFFMQGYKYEKEVIEERRGVNLVDYLKELKQFIITKVTEKIISQDLNYLLPPDKFGVIRKTIKQEVAAFLKDEIRRLRCCRVGLS